MRIKQNSKVDLTMENIIMKKKAYKKPEMTVYDLPSPMPLLGTSDPTSVPGLPGWPNDFG